MFRFLVISACFVGILNAGLREDIENEFNECDKTTGTVTEYNYERMENEEVGAKSQCFMAFLSKYGEILKRQCNNNKKYECAKLLYSYSHYTLLDGLDEIVKKYLEICDGEECYKAAEIIGLEFNISQPLLEKACKQNVDDACYAIGK